MAGRPPKDMKGLLKFCLTAGDDFSSGTSNFSDFDEEKRKWLQEALASMTVDVVKQMKENIKIVINKMDSDKEEDIQAAVAAMTDLVALVEDMDCANDFVKIGGFELVRPLLVHRSAELRALVGGLVGELMQNNPFCQERGVVEEILPVMITSLGSEKDSSARKKCLYGISCLVRSYQPALDQFIKYNGLAVLVQAMNDPSDAAVQTKSAFMIRCITVEHQSIKENLVESGILEKLCRLLREQEHQVWHEHVLATLITVVMALGSPGLAVCMRPDLGLVDILKKRVETLQGHEDAQESYDMAQELINILTLPTK